MSKMPEDPMTALAIGASQQHELFMAWVQAGFTRAEALELLIEVIRPGIEAAMMAADQDVPGE